MPEALTYLGALKTLFGKLPGWAVRWWYPASRLSDLLYVDLMPRNESVWMNFGSAPEIRLHLQVINLSPFVCDIEQGELTLLCGGVSVKLRLNQRRTIAAAEVAVIYLSEALSDGQAKTIKTNWGTGSTALSGTLEVASSINRFTKHILSLNGVHVHAANL